MCKRVHEDSRHETWHVDIRVGMCIFLLECVCVVIACALRWGVALVGEFIYWHCSPGRGKIFLGTGGTPGDETHPRS